MAAEPIDYGDSARGSLLERSRGLLTRVLARSERALAITFAGLILLGAVLLWLPISQASPVGFLDALFTATSAVCVTGLVVKDTGSDFTLFGQAVILVLIQLGGLGIMTFAAVAMQVLGGKLSFRSVATLSDTFYQGHAATTILRDLRRIVLMTFIIEFIGALFLYVRLGAYDSTGHARGWWAMFHAVSAFCNAGFGLNRDNLMSYSTDPFVLMPIMLLIIFGGLGHGVVLEIVRRVGRLVLRRPQQPLMWTLNSRIVLWVSAGLILFGCIALMFLEVAGPAPTWSQSFWGALFQSVTCRTAGFNTVDMAAVPQTALLVMILLMFIGGSPASCAGGVKTTSVATWFAQLWAWLRGSDDVTLLGRRLPTEVVARAAMIIGLGVVWCALGGMILTWFEQPHEVIELEDLLFEQVSAFGTVGLSTGITPSLSSGSKVWLILSMFVGRIGPLTAAMLVSRRGTGSLRYPEERLLVG